jgi:hypothetical protein
VLLADAVALVHGAAVLLMLVGALLALRRRWVLYVHAPVSLAILAVNLAGAPCPLTELELALRARAGEPGYTGGFLGHYVVQPLGSEIHGTGVQIGIYTIALLPNVVGYGLLAARAVRGPDPGHRSVPRRAVQPGGGVRRTAASPSRTPTGSRTPSGGGR